MLSLMYILLEVQYYFHIQFLILNFQILNLSKIKLKLTKLNVKFLLILTDLFSLFFNNKKINDFLFYYYLIKLI